MFFTALFTVVKTVATFSMWFSAKTIFKYSLILVIHALI